MKRKGFIMEQEKIKEKEDFLNSLKQFIKEIKNNEWAILAMLKSRYS